MSRKGRKTDTPCRKSGSCYIGSALPDGWASTMATKKKTSTPAVRYLRYELTNSPTPGVETSHYIDLAKDVSALNRRLYRQGRCYHVKRVSIVSSNTLPPEPGQNFGRITVATVPDSWVARNAWRRGFGIWNDMNKDATRNMSSDIKGTWSDFKIYLSGDHRSGAKLIPKDNGGNNVSFGEWNYSSYVSSDGTTGADEFEVVFLGNHSGGAGIREYVGLIESYQNSRATVQQGDPAVLVAVSDDPLVNLMDDGTTYDEIIDNLEAENDNPPYDPSDYPGSAANTPKPLVVQQTTLGADGRSTVGGFSAMCGLIELETTSPVENDVYSVLVELAPGSYRGIAAEVI